MEKRILNVMMNKVGAHTKAFNHKITIPNSWAKAMGITKEDRAVEVTFKKNTITIKKAKNTNKDDNDNIDKNL